MPCTSSKILIKYIYVWGWVGYKGVYNEDDTNPALRGLLLAEESQS